VAAPLREPIVPPPFPEIDGGWTTILADPPWRFQNRTGKVAPEHRRLDRYSTMELDDICALPVAEYTSKNAHLYLWVPNALLPDGLRVMESWGFRYISNVIWAKRRKDGGPDGRGVGFYFRNVTEILLFGVKGSMRTLPPARSQVNMIETQKREHSRKPDEQYDFIQRCSPGPYLELFARYPQKGWHVWGEEADIETVPRGKVHKGYRGADVDVPHLESRERLTKEQSLKLSAEFRDRYMAGDSIRDIADASGYSIGRVRRLLQLAETPIRKKGRQKAS
jgi:N6-adenosine-specific RNA methylase IME4